MHLCQLVYWFMQTNRAVINVINDIKNMQMVCSAYNRNITRAYNTLFMQRTNISRSTRRGVG